MARPSSAAADDRAQQPLPTVILCLLAITAAAIVVLLPRWLDPALATAPTAILAANAWPLVLLWLLLWALTRRAVTAASLVALLAVAFYTANQIKLQNLEVPLMPADLRVAGQFVTSAELFLRYLDFNPLHALLPACVLLLWLYEPVPHRNGGVLRATTALLMLLMLAGIPLGWQPSGEIYRDERMGTNLWAPRQAASEVGVVAFFAFMSQTTLHGPRRPERAVLADFEARLGGVRDAHIAAGSTDELPDLIILQSESFFDPGRLRGVDGSAFIPNFLRLRKRSLHGELRVPAYGGLTTRTEFEVLTGIPLSTLPGVQYPYQSHVQRPLHSLPWALKSQGYATRAVHPYDRRFYQRDRVFPLLGFDSFHSISEFGPDDHYGYFVSDRALGTRVIELLDGQAPQLVVAISMENHGPWDADRPLPPAALAEIGVPDTLSIDEAHQLRGFLHHTRNVDAALGELADWVAARDQPTLLLFYGDHMPALFDVFARLGFDDGEEGSEQPLPWLVFDNRTDRGEALNLHTHELAAVLLDAAGINTNPYFASSSVLRRQASALGEEQRRSMQHNLALEALLANVEMERPAWAPGHMADVHDWAPKGVEAVAPGDATDSTFWVTFEQPPPRGTYLRLGHKRLDITRVTDHHIHGLLSQARSRAVFSRPGTLPLEAVDPLSGLVQKIGEFEVRPRADRIVLADGRQSRRFCAIEGWGPQTSSRDGSSNLQPDGKLGLWVKAACLPRSARLAFGDQRLDTDVLDQVATAGVPLALLRRGGEVLIRLLDADSEEWVDLGHLVISD
jgi:hypothetical protein